MVRLAATAIYDRDGEIRGDGDVASDGKIGGNGEVEGDGDTTKHVIYWK